MSAQTDNSHYCMRTFVIAHLHLSSVSTVTGQWACRLSSSKHKLQGYTICNDNVLLAQDSCSLSPIRTHAFVVSSFQNWRASIRWLGKDDQCRLHFATRLNAVV
jgi:hypothetical protein